MNNNELKSRNRFSDKRSEARIECKQSVQVIMPDNTQLDMTALNYSMGGVGIKGSVYQVIPHVGDKLKIHFTLDAKNSRQVDISGIVKHINLDGGTYYLGLGV